MFEKNPLKATTVAGIMSQFGATIKALDVLGKTKLQENMFLNKDVQRIQNQITTNKSEADNAEKISTKLKALIEA